ncbi:capsid assembly scaffolding protein Gp46 family protein [Bacillus sp. FSL R10-2780]|uniref:capsid assembly scaffolding protein Gp46 family protein n=1 Tax=Bacillus sp. FSL R10-2780 TaxID=2954660 RepID=UPI0030F512D9
MFKKEQELPYRLNLQFFAEGEEGGENPGGGEELGGEKAPEFTLDHFQSFLDTNVDAQKVVQSRVDSGVSKGVESFKTKTMPDLIQKEIAKRTEKTPEQIEMEEMKNEIAKMKSENIRKTIETEVAKQADKLGIDADFALTFCIDPTSLDNTIKNVTKFNEYAETLVSERVQKSVDERFANNYAKGADLTLPKTNEIGNTSSLSIIQKQMIKQ